MSSPPPTTKPPMRPPFITVPTSGGTSPWTPPTAVGDGFADMDDDLQSQTTGDKDSELDSDEEGELFALPYASVQERLAKGATIFGFHRSKKSRKMNSPFDFVEKLPEDPPYEEMGETARLWKIFLQERSKVDADNVQNWKDALDVLLVFAGLFSAVVSSFVLQTCQSLQVDNVQIIALLVVEMVGLQRATTSGLDANTVAATDLSPLTDFRPARSAIWVNGLWFVSLVLCITTALIAGLTKQWVNEYLNSAQVGTPRTLSRIRQFRAVQLEAWHVPMIIGLLPVLMHVALGVFLAGLIIFLFTLSTPLTIAISVVTAGALATYLSTNILPLYNPSCPYKTPLTSYLYSGYHYLCHLELSWLYFRVTQVIRAAVFGRASVETTIPACTVDAVDAEERMGLVDAKPTVFGWATIETTMPSSLKDAEERMVLEDGESLDGHVAVWLYNVSANTSIHRAVIEGLSNVPLPAIKLVKDGIHRLHVSIIDTLRLTDITNMDSMPTYDRLLRSLLRFFPDDDEVEDFVPPALDPNDTTLLPVLLDSSRPRLAAEYLKGEMKQCNYVHDVASWTQILRNALRCGPDFLDVEQHDSWVTATLIDWLSVPHMCADCGQKSGSAGNVYSVKLCNASEFQPSYEGRNIHVTDNTSIRVETTSIGTSTAVSFKQAVQHFLLPSLSDIIFRLDISTPCHHDIPSDIQLHLSLVRSYAIQQSSQTDNEMTLVGKMITCIRESVGINSIQATHIQHANVTSATFSAVAEIFASETVLSPHDIQRILHPLFRSLILNPKLEDAYRTWINDILADRLVNVLLARFSPVYEVGPLLADVFEFAVRIRCPILLPRIYMCLANSNWLTMLPNPVRDAIDSNPAAHDARGTSFLVASFVRGLDVLRTVSPIEHLKTLAYIQRPVTLIALSTNLILSDVDTRNALQCLATIVPAPAWSYCLKGITCFIASRTTVDVYERRRSHIRHPYIYGRCLTYDTLEGMTSYCAELSQSASDMCSVSSLVVTSSSVFSSLFAENRVGSERHEMV